MQESRLFQLVTLMLYLGPLVAGLAGHGWSVVPLFAAIFVLWQVFQRPADWPRDAARWREPGVFVGALSRVALLVVLVAVCLGVGRGIGGALGYLPGVPVGVPLALSFLSLPLARLLWSPQGSDVPQAPQRREGDDPLHDTIRPLLDLPGDTQDGTAQAAVARLGDSPMAGVLLRALGAALIETDAPSIPARRGLILWATEPTLAAQFRGGASLHDAWSVAQGRPDLLRLFAARSLALLSAQPEARGDFPPSARVRDAAAAMPDADAAREVAALAAALD